MGEVLEGHQDRQLTASKIIDDSLAKALQTMMRCLEADYHAQFVSAFGTDEKMRAFKVRIWNSLKSFSPIPDDVYAGYDNAIADGDNKRFMPTLPVLVEHIKRAHDGRVKALANRLEAGKVAALPAKTVECNPLELLKGAKEVGVKRSKAELLAEHEALIKAHMAKGLIKRVMATDKDRCAVDGCHSVGAISSSARGGGNFYCVSHARMMV